MREDLSELLAEAIGDVPSFSTATLAMRVRRRRQRQIGAVAGTAATAVALTFVVAHPDRDRGLAVRTRDGGPTTTAEPTSSTDITTSTTEATTSGAPTIGSTAATTTTVPPPAPPQVGDFTGRLTASTTTLTLGETTVVDLTIRNVTDHAIDLTPYEGPTWIGLNCAEGSDPSPGREGVFYTGWTFADKEIDPGATRELVIDWKPTMADSLGPMYCAAAIVDAADTPVRFFPSWTAVTAIPSVEITVLTSPDSTTTTSAPTTSVPGSTTVPMT
jgi:hypothetical protein